MTRISRLILVVALSSAVVVGIWLSASSNWPGAQSSGIAQAVEEPTRTLTVVGEGTALAEPDVAWINVGVETLASTATEAIRENDNKMAKVDAKLQELGIPDQDIQTSAYSINPEYNSQQDQPGQITGYRASNVVRVTIHDLEEVGSILDQATQAGADTINGISFGVEDQAELQAEARAEAMADAQARAVDLARLSGLQLGGVVSINEEGSDGPVPIANAVRAAPSIQPGQLEIHSRIQVTYAMH
jgi:uncharacterized protein YggE